MRIELAKFFLTIFLLLFGTTHSATAATFQYTTTLSPEVTGATGTGSALITLDTVANTMRVEASFAGLSGTTTAAHIHCCTTTPGIGSIGVATITPSFTNWPNGANSGAYDFTYDTTNAAATFNSPFVTANGGTAAGALAALMTGMDEGRAYFNIHTSAFTGGEIRGFLVPLPEPGTALLLGIGLGLLGMGRSSRP